MNKRNVEDIIAEQAEKGGIKVNDLDAGLTLEVQTLNTLYTIEVLENNKTTIQGGSRFPEKRDDVIFNGSTFGGSMIKMKWIGIDMHMEFWRPVKGGLLTSPVQSIKILGDGWEWDITE